MNHIKKYNNTGAMATKNPHTAQGCSLYAKKYQTNAKPDRRNHSAENANVPCMRSEEHTSELQSRENLVCRLLLEKKKKNRYAADNDYHELLHKTELYRNNTSVAH